MATEELHVIANAHMDPVWIWDWREGFGEVWATFRSALDRLRENPELTFTASSAAHHAWIAEHDPAMFAEIAAAVAAGRWRLVGGMWIEPDCNLPSGESMCRQLLAGQRYFQESFGQTARVGYNVDSFGHAAGLPQLLLRAGLASYVFMRPGEHERDLSRQLFRWRDLSGAELPAYRIPFDYATMSPGDIPELFNKGAKLAATQESPLMLFVGVGNHGGGPTRATLAEVDRVRAVDPAVRYSDPERYFAIAGVPLPEVTGELQHHAVGCYSVSAWVKAANDHAEGALLDAESTDLIAARLAGRTARQGELSRAWQELLLCQFHDILAGTASSRAYPTIAARFGHVETIADQVTTNSLYQIAHRVGTNPDPDTLVERHWSFWAGSEGQGVPFFVYNPLGWAVRQPVVATRPAEHVLDSAGREIGHQAVASGEVTLYGTHTLFTAELPPMGYEVFWLRGGQRAGNPPQAPAAPVIESDRLRAEVDPATGAITSLREIATGRELLAAGGIRPELRADASDTWSHGLVRYEGDIIHGRFMGWETIESGPIRWTMRLRFDYEGSTVTEDLSLTRGMPYAQLRIRANWSMPKVVLKLVLPWRLGEDVQTVAGAAYGLAERTPSGAEEPVQGWLDCFSPSSGLGVGLTTGHLHGYDAIGGTVALTVIRNPLAADHGGKWATADSEDFPCTDTGPHDAVIRIHPHEGDWRSADLVARADEQARPPLVIADTYHPGPLPPKGGFLTVTPANVPVVRALKRAEGGEGIVIRLVEPIGERLTVTISGEAVGRGIQTTLQPFEVQTLLVPDNGEDPVRPVSLAEYDLES